MVLPLISNSNVSKINWSFNDKRSTLLGISVKDIFGFWLFTAYRLLTSKIMLLISVTY